MKKFALILALCMLLGGCATEETGLAGLVTEEVTTDPNATRIVSPLFVDETHGTNAPTPGVTAPPETEPPKPKETRITFLAAGDNIVHENVFLDAKSRAKAGETYNFIDMYDGVADMIAAADLAFINQETPICGDDKFKAAGYPRFNTPEAMGTTLVELGFDIVNVAHNHTLDNGEAGYRGTLDYWKEWADDITMIGGYYNKADYENIRVIEEQGVKIALLSYTFGTNSGTALPAGSEMIVPIIKQDEVVRMTKKAAELADLVFVVMHWGDEYQFKPNATQKNLAAAITEAGADVIIGMHPHVIQPVEWKTASDGSKTLVYYSLGNFISTQYDNFNMVGGIGTFDIVKNESGVHIENAMFHPTVTHYNKQRLGLQVYLMEDYTAELCALHGTPNYGKDKTWNLPHIYSYATKNIAAEFLPDFLTN